MSHPKVGKPLRRSCFRGDGQPKARLDASTAKAREAEGLGEAYLCPVCNWFHVGSRRGGVKVTHRLTGGRS